jgi:hypothetical protein
MKFNSTSKNPRADLKNKMVQYNQTTGLFTNPDRTIAFKSYEDANRYNMSLGGTPGVKPSETPMQDTLKNIRKPLKDKPKGVQYKDVFQRNEERRKEQLNKAWGIEKPKLRQETSLERIHRIGYEHSSDANLKKPEHMSNPNIIKWENWKQPPRKFDSQDKTTYPSDVDQRERMSTWDLYVEKARKFPGDEDSKDTRRMLMKQYYNKDQRGDMTDKELKIIGKHKSQLEKPKPIIDVSSFEPLIKPHRPSPEPEVSIDEVIKEKAGIEPGISKDLLQLNADINKNIKYVLGEKAESQESENEKSKSNIEEGEPND